MTAHITVASRVVRTLGGRQTAWASSASLGGRRRKRHVTEADTHGSAGKWWGIHLSRTEAECAAGIVHRGLKPARMHRLRRGDQGDGGMPHGPA